MTVGAREDVRIIRPAAILDERAAAQVLQQLRRLDVSAGGVWNATSSLWQRYDAPWDGVGGTRGEAKLLGSIAVMYDSPHRHEITIYKVTVSENGLDQGWTVESLCDDALIWAGLTIATCPRAELASPPLSDPFRLKDGRRQARPQAQSDALPVGSVSGRGGPGPGRRPAGRPRRTPPPRRPPGSAPAPRTG